CRRNMAAGPHPPGGDASFHLEKDDGVGLTSIDMMPKKYGCRSSPPPPARKRDCDQGRWGYRVNSDDRDGAQVEMSVLKNYRCKSYTPFPALPFWYQRARTLRPVGSSR